ncbi:MAG: methylated-DNA--[protein]-cysteine S-methyltransferase [Proteobacteria bacterium]|nr:methylated-DNA--[protein]-cysteine S-methyltransferase [Pseudomonadota bacterium]
MPHRWSAFDTRFARFAAAIDDDGRLVRFWLHADEGRGPQGIRDDGALSAVRTQVEEYCGGERQAFDLITHAETGSDFERDVWAAMREIPFGETTTYGAIAKALGDPGAARAVGLACNANPIPLVVPCHRVIGANGALVGFGGGLPLKRALLDFESVVAGHPRDLFASR